MFAAASPAHLLPLLLATVQGPSAGDGGESSPSSSLGGDASSHGASPFSAEGLDAQSHAVSTDAPPPRHGRSAPAPLDGEREEVQRRAEEVQRRAERERRHRWSPDDAPALGAQSQELDAHAAELLASLGVDGEVFGVTAEGELLFRHRDDRPRGPSAPEGQAAVRPTPRNQPPAPAARDDDDAARQAAYLALRRRERENDLYCAYVREELDLLVTAAEASWAEEFHARFDAMQPVCLR
jgi:hypothetical protein